MTSLNSWERAMTHFRMRHMDRAETAGLGEVSAADISRIPQG